MKYKGVSEGLYLSEMKMNCPRTELIQTNRKSIGLWDYYRGGSTASRVFHGIPYSNAYKSAEICGSQAYVPYNSLKTGLTQLDLAFNSMGQRLDQYWSAQQSLRFSNSLNRNHVKQECSRNTGLKPHSESELQTPVLGIAESNYGLFEGNDFERIEAADRREKIRSESDQAFELQSALDPKDRLPLVVVDEPKMKRAIPVHAIHKKMKNISQITFNEQGDVSPAEFSSYTADSNYTWHSLPGDQFCEAFRIKKANISINGPDQPLDKGNLNRMSSKNLCNIDGEYGLNQGINDLTDSRIYKSTHNQELGKLQDLEPGFKAKSTTDGLYQPYYQAEFPNTVYKEICPSVSFPTDNCNQTSGTHIGDNVCTEQNRHDVQQHIQDLNSENMKQILFNGYSVAFDDLKMMLELKRNVIHVNLVNFLSKGVPGNIFALSKLPLFNSFLPSSLVVGFIYLDKYMPTIQHTNPDCSTFIKCYFTCCLLAMKYVEDTVVSVQYLVTKWGFKAEEIIQIEANIVRYLKYDLWISNKEIQEVIMKRGFIFNNRKILNERFERSLRCR